VVLAHAPSSPAPFPVGSAPSPADFQRIPVALLLTINGFLVVIDLAALAGIWLLKA
jgi:hypothetical protein